MQPNQTVLSVFLLYFFISLNIQFNLVLGNPEFSHDGSVVNEIKIAEIVEMRSEVAEENNFCCLLQEEEFR